MLNDFNRRRFIKGLTLSIGVSAISIPLFTYADENSPSEEERITPKSSASDSQKKLGIALVGLGKYSSEQLAPALKETKNCYLAGIVTGTPSKAQAWKKQYNIPDKNIYDYQNFDSIIENKDIDIVYVVLPNSLHAEYVIRAAKAKKHVICEKPMATTVEDAQAMIKACQGNGVQLAIGYRLYFDPFHQRVMELGQKEVFGKVKEISAINSGDQTKGSLDVWRLDRKRSGGGPLMDMGIYCVQAVCYTMGKPPVAVTAKFGEITKPSHFQDVEQSISWQMEFEGGVIAECKSSYAESEDSLSGKAEKGWWKISPSFGYEGKKGETSQGKLNLPNIYEQAFQMDGQAESFRNKQNPITSGEMGLRDVKILMAIYESANNGSKKVMLNL